MPDGFHETPVRGKLLHNGTVPDANAVGVLPAIASDMDPVTTEGNVVSLSTDLKGALRVVLTPNAGGDAATVALDAETLTALESVDLNETTIEAIAAALESIDLNLATRDDLVNRLSANLESVDLNPATRDDLVTRITTALEDVGLNIETRDDLVTRLSANLESVDLNAATRDDLVARLSANLESVDLNAATRDDIVARLVASIEAQTATLSTNLEDVGLNAPTRDDLVARLAAAIEASHATTRTALESVDLNAPTLAALERTTPQTRGADVDDLNPLPVVLQSNPGTLRDTGLLTSVDLAPGATAEFTSTAVTGTGRFLELTAASSVRIKVTLLSGATGALVAHRVFFVDPTGASLVYRGPERDSFATANGDTYVARVTNLDNLRTADVYASLVHTEA